MPLLTTYRPNFCAECGGKIARLRWRVWTSRRFCDNCYSDFAKAHWQQPAVATIALLIFGVLIGRGCRHEHPPLVIERTVNSAAQNSSDTPVSQPSFSEQLYTCGARTKKGTPCSRRVHGPVRCWQHKGMKAMLTQEKLLVKE